MDGSIPLTARQERGVLVFRAGAKRFALPVESVGEVVLMPWLLRPGTLPPALEGFLNWGGRVVPVLRFARLFDLPEKPSGLYTPLIVIEDDSCLLALLVEQVEDVSFISTEDALPAPPEDSFNGCVAAELTHQGETIHLLAAGRLLLEKERRCLAQFQEMAQKRLSQLQEPGL